MSQLDEIINNSKNSNVQESEDSYNQTKKMIIDNANNTITTLLIEETQNNPTYQSKGQSTTDSDIAYQDSTIYDAQIDAINTEKSQQLKTIDNKYANEVQNALYKETNTSDFLALMDKVSNISAKIFGNIF